MVPGTNYGVGAKWSEVILKLLVFLLYLSGWWLAATGQAVNVSISMNYTPASRPSHGHFHHSDRGEIILSSADTLHLKLGRDIIHQASPLNPRNC